MFMPATKGQQGWNRMRLCKGAAGKRLPIITQRRLVDKHSPCTLPHILALYRAIWVQFVYLNLSLCAARTQHPCKDNERRLMHSSALAKHPKSAATVHVLTSTACRLYGPRGTAAKTCILKQPRLLSVATLLLISAPNTSARLQGAPQKTTSASMLTYTGQGLTRYSSSRLHDTGRLPCTACTASCSFAQVSASKPSGSLGLPARSHVCSLALL